MKKLIYIIAILLVCNTVYAQDGTEMNYKRSAIYPILLSHPENLYSYEIDQVYSDMKSPDKFDDHSLNLKSFSTDRRHTKDEEITEFLEKNNVGRRMVAKWFKRNKSTGLFDTGLIVERGNYNASKMDVEVAKGAKRSYTLLADAGTELIPNTFVLVHEITYIDKERVARAFSTAFQIIGVIAGGIASATSGDNQSYANIAKSAADLGSTISDQIAGFTVKTTSHLYQLEWNDEIENQFYDLYWCDKNTPSDSVLVRKRRFDTSKGLFKLKYVGSYVARSQKTVLKGLNDQSDVIRKVCTRALDKNIAMLQREFEVFRVKTPVIKVEGDQILANIGMKEEVDANSKFEVLEVSTDNNGTTVYKRAGIIKPIRNKIWDNRYMAVEEEADGSTLPGTTFEIVSGKNFYPGMLIREIR